MAIIKCKMCGGDLNILESSTVAECEYCGTKQTVPSMDSEKKLTLFSRANRLRFACEFDKAAGIYESIVTDFPEEAEAYWGLVLCKYGIEYVDDPATAKKIPTCHRSSFESLMDDANFEHVMENSDVIARKVYREEAKVIEELRKSILEISSKEDPYDIFICYKETDENGNRTLDSVLAQDVYDALTENGYRVFFSRITLEDKLGQEYEPYIFAALHSAKVMLAIGTDYEYYNAVWVKNEWRRFLQLIVSDEKKTLIPCFKGIDAYDMPKEFAKLQAQDLGKVGAIQDLLRGINKLFEGDLRQDESVRTSAMVEKHLVSQAQSQADNIVRLGVMSLNRGDVQKAEKLFEESFKLDSEHIGTILGMLRIKTGDAICPYVDQLCSFSAEDVELWLKRNPSMLDDSRFPLLDIMIKDVGSYDMVKAVLNAGAKPDGQYALYYAIRSGENTRVELTKLLIEFGADVNKKYQLSFRNGKETRSLLSDAIWEAKDVNLVEILVQNGANVNDIIESSTGQNWSILDLAVRINSLPMVQLLLKYGADPNSGRQYSSETFYCVLSEAIWNVKNTDIVKALLNNGAEPNYVYTNNFKRNLKRGEEASVHEQRSSLFDAICFSKNNDMVKVLLESGANPSQQYTYTPDWPDCALYGIDGITVPILAIAILKQNKEAINMLLDAGASLDELCYRQPWRKSARIETAPLKKCDFGFSDTMKGYLQSLGWKGPSIFSGIKYRVYWN